MRNLYAFIYLVIAMVSFSGCVTLYKPNVIHSPMLKEKGELNAAGSIGFSGSGIYNVQTAYAVSEHVGVIADGMYHSRYTTNGDSTEEVLKIFTAELGAGYFTTFGAEKRGLFQCYAGIGSGRASDRIKTKTQPQPNFGANYYSAFFQPGIGYFNDNFEFMFDTRFNYVNLYNVNGYLVDKFEWWNTSYQYFNHDINFVLMEPTVTFKAGSRNLKGLFQFGVTLPMKNPDSYFAVNPASYWLFPLIKFSMGVQYTFLTSR